MAVDGETFTPRFPGEWADIASELRRYAPGRRVAGARSDAERVGHAQTLEAVAAGEYDPGTVSVALARVGHLRGADGLGAVEAHAERQGGWWGTQCADRKRDEGPAPR